MEHKSFFYYGYDKETYIDCLDMIRLYNRKNAIIMNAWFFVVNLLYVVFSSFNLFGVTVEQTPFYATYTIISIIYALIMFFFQKETERNSTVFVYILMAGMYTYGVLKSIMHPYMPAIMYLTMYLLINLLFIGNVIRVYLLAIFSTLTFLYTSFLLKTFSIAYHDMYNVFMTMLLAGGLHYMFQRERLGQFVMYKKNLEIQRELEIKSSFDSLTDLLSRGRFFSIAEKVLLAMEKDEYVAVCILDLDGFKQINDKLGHQMGDKVIQTTGKIIVDVVDEKKLFKTERMTSLWDLKMPYSIAGRLGGDEFIILMRGKKSKDEVSPLLQNMLDRLNSVRFDSFDGIHASFGVTQIIDGETDMDGAYSRADSALYESKREGKNRIKFYEDIKEDIKGAGEEKR